MTHPFGNPAYLFNTGKNDQAYKFLGAHVLSEEETVFRVWAPQAQRVEVLGDFNKWQKGVSPCKLLDSSGIWEFIYPASLEGCPYKFWIVDCRGRGVEKADPFAFRSELRPQTASIVCAETRFEWTDWQYLQKRPPARANNFPLNIYEVHPGSFMRHPDGRFYTYQELAERLGNYCLDMGFNFVELMPVMEHPLDASWGYQVTGYFAPTARFGDPDGFRYFVNHLHSLGIGVILDWVPAHFPKDEFALYHFDGSPTFEPCDPRMAEQKEWGTMLFDYGKAEVRSFLISSAVYWLQEFHVDGLRVDAVSTILYRNYGSANFVPNEQGGRENFEGIAFLKELNRCLSERFPYALLMAEEATTWPYLTTSLEEGGIGFTYKWDMGWMHDTLNYFSKDYLYRNYHHHDLTFSMSYAFSERFLLPLSHDEVVHGKHSLIERMPGDYWRQFACLRTLYAYMIGHPGAKLLFMGGEFAQFIEWRFYEELQWFMLEYDAHRQMQDWVRSLNHLYLENPACWERDTNWEGFRWIEADDAKHSFYSFYRRDHQGRQLIFLLNETPVPLKNYELKLPEEGLYEVVLNSDDSRWGGSDYPMMHSFYAEENKFVDEIQKVEMNPDQKARICLDIPPLAAVVLRYKGKKKETIKNRDLQINNPSN